MPTAIGEAIMLAVEAGTLSTAWIETGVFLIQNATIISTVGALAITNAQAQSAKRKARDAAAASAQDRVVTFRGATLPRREVLGRAITGGDLMWPASTGASKTELVMVIALSAREIDGVEKVFYDGEEITLNGSGFAVSGGPFTDNEAITTKSDSKVISLGDRVITLSGVAIAGTVSVFVPASELGGVGSASIPLDFTLSGDGTQVTVGSTPYVGDVTVSYQSPTNKNALRILFHTGAAGQVVDPVVTAMFPTEWNSSHRLDGVAYAVVIAKYDTSTFAQGLKGFSFLVRGSKVFDPRTSTTAWSDNPALLIRHVCAAPLDPAIPGVPVNDADCIAAANVCDQTVSYTVGGVAKTRKRYIAGTIYSEADAPIKSIDELCQAMAGGRVFTGGKLRMRAGAYVTPVMTLGDADFMGGAVDVVPTIPREQLVNVANAKAWDPDNRWQFVDVPEVRSSAYITADGGALPPLAPELAAVNNVAQAQQLLAIMLREARSAFTITAQFRMTAYPVEVFDVVSVFNSRYMAAPMTMIVLGRKWSLDGGIVLTLRATSADIYADGTAFDAPLIPPASLLPKPWLVASPGALTIVSDPVVIGDTTQTSRMQVSWPLHPDESVRNGGAIEIQYRLADESEPSGDWPGVSESGRATTTTIRGVLQGRSYLVRARAWNGPAVSDWGTQKVHQVSAAPLVGRSGLAENSAATVASSTVSSQVDSIATGIAAQLVIVAGTSTGPFEDDEPVEVTFSAHRLLESVSGVVGGAVAAFHFIRLYKNGVFWFNFPTAADNMNDAILPLLPGTRMQIRHNNSRTILLPAGNVLTAESVWSIKQPASGEDVTATTKAADLRLTTVHK